MYHACKEELDFKLAFIVFDGISVFYLVVKHNGMASIKTSLPVCFMGCSFDKHLMKCSVYRVSQEECARLRESVPYVKVCRYNPKHIYPKLNGYGDNGQRKVWSSCGSTYCTWSADASTAFTLSSVM